MTNMNMNMNTNLDIEDNYEETYPLRQPDLDDMTIEEIYLYWQQEFAIEIEAECRSYEIMDTHFKSIEDKHEEKEQ